MKKKLLLAALLTTMVASSATGVVAAFADTSGDASTTDMRYTLDHMGDDGSATVLANGYTALAGFSQYGERMVYGEKVHFDGLTVSFYAADLTKNDRFGFYLGTEDEIDSAYWGSGGSSMIVTALNALYGSNPAQNRLNIGTAGGEGTAVIYTTPDCTTAGFGVATSHVSNSSTDPQGYSVSFKSYNDTVYAVTVKMLYSEMWGNNANYNSTEKTSTVYLPKATVAPDLDENGDTYLFFAAGPNGYDSANAGDLTDEAITMNVKIDDFYTSVDEKAALTGEQNSAEWYAREASKGAYATYNPDTKKYTFNNLDSYAESLASYNKVKVDGLVVDLYANKYGSGQRFGFGFIDTIGGYGPENRSNADIATYHAEVLPDDATTASQTRLNSGLGVGNTAMYKDRTLTTSATTFSGSIVMNYVQNEELHFRMTFEYLPAEGEYTTNVYKLVIEILSGTRHGQQSASPVTIYFDAKYVEHAQDSNGLVYFYGYCHANSSSSELVYSLKYEDDLTRAAVTDVNTKIGAYETALGTLENVGTAKNGVVSALIGMREVDQKAAYTAFVAVENTLAPVSAKYAAAKAAVDTMNGAVTAANVQAATSALSAANTAYTAAKDSLSADNQTALEALASSYATAIATAEATIEEIEGELTAAMNAASSAVAVLDNEVSANNLTAAKTALDNAWELYQATYGVISSDASNGALYTYRTCEETYEEARSDAYSMVTNAYITAEDAANQAASEPTSSTIATAQTSLTSANEMAESYNGLFSDEEEALLTGKKESVAETIAQAENALAVMEATAAVQAKINDAKTAVEAMEANNSDATVGAAELALAVAGTEYAAKESLLTNEDKLTFGAAMSDYQARITAVKNAMATAAATAAVQAKYDDAKTAVEAMEADTTDETIAAAEAALTAANEEYAAKKTLISADDQATFEASAADYAARITAAKEKGCGSVIGGAGVVTMLTLVGGAYLAMKKRKED